MKPNYVERRAPPFLMASFSDIEILCDQAWPLGK